MAELIGKLLDEDYHDQINNLTDNLTRITSPNETGVEFNLTPYLAGLIQGYDGILAADGVNTDLLTIIEERLDIPTKDGLHGLGRYYEDLLILAMRDMRDAAKVAMDQGKYGEMNRITDAANRMEALMIELELGEY
jgi:hypothetical protein